MTLEEIVTVATFTGEINVDDDAVIVAIKKGDTVRMCVEGKPKECNKLKQKLYSLVGGREAK